MSTAEAFPSVRRSIPDVDENTSTYSASVAYGKAGLYHGPVAPRTKHPAGMLGRAWQEKTSIDPAHSDEWFIGRDHGIFLHPGKSGLVVFDIDHPENVPDLLRDAILRCQPPYQTTRDPEDVVNGVSRGHYLFECPPGQMFSNSTGGLGKGWGEVRGKNGLIVVAPSIHEEAALGGFYRWRRTGPIPVLPPEIAELLIDASSGEAGAADEETVRAFYADHTASTAPHLLTPVIAKFKADVAAGGSRHDAMTTAATWAMRDARAGLYPAGWAAEQLERALSATVRGEKRPRGEFRGIANWAVARAGEDPAEKVAERADRPRARLAAITDADIEAIVDRSTGTTPRKAAVMPVSTPALIPVERDDFSDIIDPEFLAPEVAADPTPAERSRELLLPESFWQSRASLRHIRQAAHARQRSADVVLHAVLARFASIQHPGTQVDTGIASPASLNVITCVVAPSGGGKSSGISLAPDLIVPTMEVEEIDGSGYHDELSVGSGEGLIEMYMGEVEEERPTGVDEKPKRVKVRRQVRQRAYVVVDEGESLTKQSERSGSLLMEVLRSMWSGSAVGQQNSNPDRTRQLRRGSYSFGMVTTIQVQKAGWLFDDAAGGTPQRFLFAWAKDPNIPRQRPRFPGPLTTMLPYCAQPIGVTPSILERIQDDDLRAQWGELERPELDVHEPLHLIKVSCLLALLDGRNVISEEDWSLAQQVWDTSRRVRATMVEEIDRSRAEDAHRGDVRAATRQVVVKTAEVEVVETRAEKLVAKAAKAIARRVWRTTPGPSKRRELTQAVAGRDRREYGPELVDDALAQAGELGFITEKDGEFEKGPTPPPEA